MFNNKDLKQKLEERQTLSRLMDGEWADLNPAESVVGLCKNDALKAKWERYHLIRDVMRNEPVEVDSALSLRISAAIADEPSYSNVTALSGGMSSAETSAAQTDSTVTPIGVMPKWRTSLVGLGIAASVAMVTVVGMNQLQVGNQEGNQSAQVAAATDNVPASVVTAEEAFSQQVPGAPLPQVEFRCQHRCVLGFSRIHQARGSRGKAEHVPVAAYREFPDYGQRGHAALFSSCRLRRGCASAV